MLFPKQDNSADALGEAHADDHHRYCLKDDVGGRCVRASEWLGTLLARDLGIKTPEAEVIELFSGETVFGSRIIANKNSVADNEVFFRYGETSAAVTSLLSEIYAYDLFVFNIDRHFGNYITVSKGNGREIYAYDFGRALFRYWPISDIPGKGQQTRVCRQILNKRHAFDAASAKSMLKRLENFNDASLLCILDSMPSDWLPTPSRQEFLTWWSNRQVRIDRIQKGLKNGKLV